MKFENRLNLLETNYSSFTEFQKIKIRTDIIANDKKIQDLKNEILQIQKRQVLLKTELKRLSTP